MELLLFLLERNSSFFVASIPLILTFLLLKIFKLPSKPIIICILLNLLASIFFWIKLRDISVALYQSVPYVSSFIWLWAENILEKRQANDESTKDEF